MKIAWLVVSLLLVTVPAWAQRAPDRRLSDNDGDVANVTSGGLLSISQTNTAGTPRTGAASDVRLSDSDTDVANITTGGALNVKWT